MAKNGEKNGLFVTRRVALLGGGAAAVAVAAPAVLTRRALAASKFEGKEIRLLTWSDETGQAAIRNIAKSFEAETGAKVISDLTSATSEMVAKLKASAGRAQYDLVILSGVGAIELARDGLLQKPDEQQLPNLLDVAPGLRTGADGFGVGYLLYCDGIIFNTKKLSTPPTSWESLWDDKFAGHLFLPPPQYTEAMELTAMAARLAGGDERNPEPGFKMLEKLRGRAVLLADNQAQLADLFRTDTVYLGGSYAPMLMSSYIRNPDYHMSGTLALKEGFFYDLQFMVIPKGHPGDDDAIYAFMNHALDAGIQAKMAEDVWYGPINQKAELSKAAMESPYIVSGKTVAERGISLDKNYLSSVRQEWIRRYTEILGS